MFRVADDILPGAFNSVIQELKRKNIPVNLYRKKSGVGRSQCFGIVRQRNGTYTGSRMNFERPELYQALISLGHKILPPDFSYTSIQLNANYQTSAHYDKGNCGESAIIGFGDYTGGELVIEGNTIDIKHRLVFFDGSKYLHETKGFEGTRYSVVFFNVDKKFKEIPIFSFYTDSKGAVLLQESINQVLKVYDKTGTCISSTDGNLSMKSQRKPTLRPCISLEEVE